MLTFFLTCLFFPALPVRLDHVVERSEERCGGGGDGNDEDDLAGGGSVDLLGVDLGTGAELSPDGEHALREAARRTRAPAQ